MTQNVNIDKLEPHPYSEQLFEQQTPSERFIEDISENLENPITIDHQNRIIDGVRRWKAAKALGWDEIEARTQQFDPPEQAKLAILRHDDNREANPAQKIRIGYEYEKQIAPLLEEKVEAGKPTEELDLDLDHPLVEILDDENVTARGLASDRVGWSDGTYYRGKRILETAEGKRQVPDEVEEKAAVLMEELAADDETIGGAFRRLKEEIKRQKRTDPVQQSELSGYQHIEKAFKEAKNDLDPTSGWKAPLSTLTETYKDQWGSLPSPEQKHLLAYQLIANDVADPYERGDPKPDPDELENRYWGEEGNDEHSLTELSIYFGVREDVVCYWLWEADIDRKSGDVTENDEDERN